VEKRRFKTAFILGAGLGIRLRPLTDSCPKPLLPINGRPIVTYAMDHLLGIGVDRFIVNTHHCPQVYGSAFPNALWRGAPILFRHEPVLLDTAGGLKNIEDLLGEDEIIICYNGDIITNLPLSPLLSALDRDRAEATLILRSSGPRLNVNITETGEICDLRHVLGRKGAQSCLFTGIYAVRTSFLAQLEAGRIESVIDVFLRRIVDQPGTVRGVIVDQGQWDDIGSVETYERVKAGGWAAR
jgi:NDP-sugar pyrophosphorylase family protein